MTKNELLNMSFEEAVSKLQEERDDIHSYDDLLEMAKHELDEQNVGMALHLLHGIYDNSGEYFSYDRCMGTLEAVTPLETLEDLEDYI